MTTFEKYQQAANASDSIRDIASHECKVVPGNNDGYFIEAFGKQYRYAAEENEKQIAEYFLAIVSMGPIETI